MKNAMIDEDLAIVANISAEWSAFYLAHPNADRTFTVYGMRPVPPQAAGRVAAELRQLRELLEADSALELMESDLKRIEACLPPVDADGEASFAVTLGTVGEAPRTLEFDTDDVRALIAEVRRLRAALR